ncbi:transmembrane 9 superfamily member 4-like [Trichogramma pretiosum]|uniref:transmembrane 9 superfamily member 4-like n=1 Tax=Trichogramma pretiosum TaxID=7493 RepID=UPI000C71C7E7|nr:transmembrane 9 superfamily member 4-like [Trichogramma pretiosum]
MDRTDKKLEKDVSKNYSNEHDIVVSNNEQYICDICEEAFPLESSPVDFKKGQKIDVEAAKMYSSRTQLSYEYYSLPFCLPKNGTLSYKTQSLGEILSGDRVVKTPYEVEMAQNISCKLLCDDIIEPIFWKESYSSLVIERIQQEYIVRLLIDDVTAANLYKKDKVDEMIYMQPGYYLGGIDEKNRVYINNYLKLIIFYHKHGENEFRIDGSVVEALSVDYKQVSYDSVTCNITPQASPQFINPNGTEILFFYSVQWVEKSNIDWANRNMYAVQYHLDRLWFRTICLILVIIFYSVLAYLLYNKAIKKVKARNDVGNSDRIAKSEGAEEKTGCNLVYADVFRPPTNSCLFAAFIGSGIQVFFMTFITVLFTMLERFSSSSRGAVGTCAIYSFSFSGLVAGYISGRLYKTMQGKEWKKAAFLTATLYPGIVFETYFSLSFFLREKHSSDAIPFSTMISLLGIWFGISLPLVFLGYFFGYRKPNITHTVTTKQKPEKIPDQVWHLNCIRKYLLTGILPFGVVFNDLFYISAALWQNYLYIFTGFILVVFILFVISCFNASTIMVYAMLKEKDYRSWWGSFMLGGVSAAHIQIYSIHYFFAKLNITELAPTLIYFGYMGLITITFWLLTGTICFFVTYLFIRKMYAVAKLE